MSEDEFLMFKGVTFGFWARNGYFSSPAAFAEVEKIASLGIPWVCLVVTVMQEAYYSTRMFRDYAATPGDDEVADIIRAFHDRGVRVMLRPMIESWDGSQRWQVHQEEGCVYDGRPFHYRTDWFENYAALTRHYLRIAAKCGVEAYGMDSELNQLLPFSDHWKRVIDVARACYKGHLTTSIAKVEDNIQYLDDPGFWLYALDSVGTSMYNPASKTGGGTAAEMADFLRGDEGFRKHRAFAAKYGKTYYFGECGCCATESASRLPYYWKNGKRYDGVEQANYLRAVLEAYSAEPWWRGLFWWKWDEQNYRPEFHEDPAGDKGFTLSGKPAEKVFADWCR